jgi:hypothetical protein
MLEGVLAEEARNNKGGLNSEVAEVGTEAQDAMDLLLAQGNK